MRQNKIQLILIALPMSLGSWVSPAIAGETQTGARTQANFSSDFLPSPDAAETPVPRVAPVPKKTAEAVKRAIHEGSLLDSKGIATLRSTVSGLGLIIQQMKPSPKRTKILMNRAAAYTQLARSLILGAKDSAVSPEAKRYLELGIVDCDMVLQSSFRDREQTWRAYDTKGVAYLYLDQSENANIAFIEALKLDPPPERKGRIAVLLAEDLFDRGKFPEAAAYYEKYISVMSAKWQELSWYKLAWCMINMGRIGDAERNFAKVIGSQSKTGVARDALRDLAYLSTHQKDVQETIARVERDIIRKDKVLEFLTEVLPNLEATGQGVLHAAMVNRLMTLEKVFEKKFDFILADLRVQRKPFATHSYHYAFQRMVIAIQKLDRSLLKPVFNRFRSEIENETQWMMKTDLDTFAGRMPTQPPMTRDQVISALKIVFEFHYRYLFYRANTQQILSLWSDVSLTSRDFPALARVTDIIISDPKRFAAIRERAYLDQISAVEQILETAKGKEGEPWKKKRALRLKEFVELFPESPQWLPVAQAHSQLEIEAGREREVLPLLEAITKRAWNHDNFYRLQYSRFKVGEFGRVLSDLRGKDFVASNLKVTEVYRESALALAVKAKNHRMVNEYRNALGWFYIYCKDPQKRVIARVDYFRFLIEKGMQDVAIKDFEGVPLPDRDVSEMEAIRSLLWSWAVEENKLDVALALSESPAAYMGQPVWKSRKALLKRFLGKIPEKAEIRGLPAEERASILAMLAVAAPERVIDFGKSYPSDLTPAEKPSVALAYKITLDQRQLTKSSELEKVLGKSYSFVEERRSGTVPLEVQMARVSVPDLSKASGERQAKLAQATFEKVQAIRQKVPDAIKERSGEDKVRILTKARELEAAVAAMLLGAQVPKELKPEQVEEYRKGVAAAAQEYQQQAEQYDAVIKGISEETKKSSDVLASRTLPTVPEDEWPWPREWEKELKSVNEAFHQKNMVGALSLLEFLRSTKNLDDKVFFTVRTGMLLSSERNNSALRYHLLNELEVNKQDAVVELWRKAADLPAAVEKKK